MPVRIPEGFKQRGNIVQAKFGGENLVARASRGIGGRLGIA